MKNQIKPQAAHTPEIYTRDVKHDIWDTQYLLRVDDDGGVMLKMPYTRWVDNSGSLDYRRVKLTPAEAAPIIAALRDNQDRETQYGDVLDAETWAFDVALSIAGVR